VRFRWLLLVPLGLVGAVVLAWSLLPAGVRPSVLTGGVETAKVLAILGCILASLAFEAGDYLRRAWMLLAVCTVFLLARDVVALAGGPAAAQGVLALAGNACSVGGTWVLARAWAVSGLDEGGPATGRVAVQAAACGVAVLVTGAPLLGDLDALLHGQVFAVVPLVSDVADAIVLVLLAPLLHTTLALRGGVLRWPWAMLTLNNVLWLVFDAAYGFGGILHVGSDRRQLFMEALRTLATAYTFSAGVAQRWAVASPAALERQPAS
jgi:hypothetical protein